MLSPDKDRQEHVKTARLLGAVGLDKEQENYVNAHPDICYDPEGTEQVDEVLFSSSNGPGFPLPQSAKKSQ